MRFFFFAGLLFFGCSKLLAQPTLTLKVVVRGLERPVDITAAPGEAASRLYVVEQPGRIRVVMGGRLLPTPFLDLTDRVLSTGNEQGLLGLAFAPDYARTGYLFVYYTDRRGDVQISRFHRDPSQPDRANPTSELSIYRAAHPFSNHNGGCLRFGPDSLLYAGLGDGGSGGDPGNRAQDLAEPLGKLLRLDVRRATLAHPYLIPPANPFVGQRGAKAEIWAWGLRNPWRFAFDRQTGDLWIADVGQNQWEEVNYLPAGPGMGGRNFGWRRREGRHDFKPAKRSPPLTEPVFEYGHDDNGGFSITGGFVYRGRAVPALAGWYVCADYVSGHWWLLSPPTGGRGVARAVVNALHQTNISTFGEDSQGELYCADLAAGIIYRVGAAH